MLLGFSQIINGKETNFAERIHRCIIEHNLQVEWNDTWDKETMRSVVNDVVTEPSKLHTIRRDKTKRWKQDNKIHPVYGQRTKNQSQFAPTMQCTGVQQFEIQHMKFDDKLFHNVLVDGLPLEDNEIDQLAINDGFNSTEEFYAYFNEDFEGKIIHWTDRRY